VVGIIQTVQFFGAQENGRSGLKNYYGAEAHDESLRRGCFRVCCFTARAALPARKFGDLLRTGASGDIFSRREKVNNV
jgi:hypothetical protein